MIHQTLPRCTCGDQWHALGCTCGEPASAAPAPPTPDDLHAAADKLLIEARWTATAARAAGFQRVAWWLKAQADAAPVAEDAA